MINRFIESFLLSSGVQRCEFMNRSQIVLSPFLAVSGNTQKMQAITLRGNGKFWSSVSMKSISVKIQASAGKLTNSRIE